MYDKIKIFLKQTENICYNFVIVPDQVGNGSLGEAKGLELNNLVTLQSLQTLHRQLGGVRQPDMAQPGRVALHKY